MPLGIITLGADNPPLTWTSYAGIQEAGEFEAERDEQNLLYPNTDVCKAACVGYIETVKQYSRDIIALRKAGKALPAELSQQAPVFPQPYYDHWASLTETASQTFNFCVSPLTPLAVRGVVWIPGKANIGKDAPKYSAALRAYAASCAKTYSQDKVLFVFAHPNAGLAEGVTKPGIEDAMSIEIDRWPKSVQELAVKLGALAARAGGD